ncbi:basic membrane protein A [Mycoplasmoides fastidiosum]|uniref:Basic membrane protein A n=1 Tax=Mycoplasmoides fastidiosum TaxID=92758 RepID=A0ABU0LYR2_9BACT|nr:BMP family ABC transporter substrate-binding protein [Mycoplasmoides fastidiosum]MDQ0513828.1 basic membrane protein A [Mycoplasmoides fastidiosum]UUD37755.1 BMP family ABC transporter substrate-binding protein [Mycoplasmoides fastidiosum]
MKRKIVPTLMVLTTSSALFLAACGTTRPKNPVTLNDSLRTTDLTRESRIGVFSARGEYDDNSVTQSTLTGVLHLSEQMKNITPSVREPYFVKLNDPKYKTPSEGYADALQRNVNLWFLVGREQFEGVKEFYEANKIQMDRRRTVFVAVDFQLPEDFAKGNSISYNFDVVDSAYVVGYATAKYIATSFNNREERGISTFGSASVPSVTQYNRGFLDGVLAYNFLADYKNRVQITTDQINLSSSDINSKRLTDTVEQVLNKTTRATLPVAGNPGIESTIRYYRKNADFAYVVGIDVDQSLVYPTQSYRFISSITKNYAQAAYDIAADLYSQTTTTIKGFEYGNKSLTITLPKEKYSGYTSSTVSNADVVEQYFKEGQEILDGLSEFDRGTVLGFTTPFNRNPEAALNRKISFINRNFNDPDAIQRSSHKLYVIGLREWQQEADNKEKMANEAAAGTTAAPNNQNQVLNAPATTPTTPAPTTSSQQAN